MILDVGYNQAKPDREQLLRSCGGPSDGHDPVLQIENLTTQFRTSEGVVRAVDGVSLAVYEGETLGVVGESGSGKSVTAMSALRLLPTPPAEVVGGHVWYQGRDLLKVSEKEMRAVRGNNISMIFQEPMTSLDPVMTVGKQIAESIRLHQGVSTREALRRAILALELVGIPEPARRVKDYPFRLSGGMRQRVMIAMALACNPRVLIADEPTTALDVTIQAQILRLMNELKDRLATAIVLITHDLGVVAEMASRVVVMYAGRVVEDAPVEQIFARPMHPYTRGLLISVPRLGSSLKDDSAQRLREIAGSVPTLTAEFVGCAFAARCEFATEICRQRRPSLDEKQLAHRVACWESERVLARHE
jgi:peptide/nickel transport system ATP-binding protein